MKSLLPPCLLALAFLTAPIFGAETTETSTTETAAKPQPAPKRSIYLANDDHTDYMWSADADTYDQVFVDLLDFHLDLADQTKDNPPPFRARFNADGNLWLWNYERKKSPEEFARLIERIKDGTISAPLNTLVSCYGGQPVEAVLRGMYYSGRLERKHDLRFRMASATENQTLPLGLASLFAGAGADYSWRGVCGCASKIPNKILMDRDRDIYWYTGHDGQRLLMKWYSLGAHNMGTYWEAGYPLKAIEFVENNPGFLQRNVDPATKKPYSLIGLFGFGGDDLARKTGVEPPPPIPAVPGLQKVPSTGYCDHFHIIAEQQTTDDRQVIVSNELDFFEAFEKKYGDTLESENVTYGNEWDLYSASMSETSAQVKRAVEKLRTAELLATLVSRKYPAFMNNHIGARDQAFTDLGLYWEHDWTADGPVTRGQRAAWHKKLAASIDYYVDSIFSEGIVRLGGMIQRPDDSNRFFVLNPLGWPRTDFADHAYTGSHDIHVRDVVTGKDVPHQIVRLRGAQYVRIMAPDVPSTGYKVFEILPGAGTAPTDPAAAVSGDGNTIFENAAVKLVVDPDGGIASFIDKRGQSGELAATIDGLKINDFAKDSAEGTLTVVNSGPVSVTLRADSEAGLDHRTEITLFRDSDRIDIRNDLNANFNNVRYWAFGFDLDDPAVHTEEVGAINLNKLKSQGGAYADTHARYDHVTLNHFADITDGSGKRGVTLSNPDLAFAKLGNSTITELDTKTPQINVLAGGQVDGRWLGIQNQNGETQFLQRFALRAHGGYDQVAAMRFALEHQNPLLAGPIISKDGKGDYDAKTFSLLEVSDPNVLLWALKPAEEEIQDGIIARFWNLAPTPQTTSIALNPGIASATRTTHIETNLEPAAVADGVLTAKFAPQQIQTFRLMPTEPTP